MIWLRTMTPEGAGCSTGHLQLLSGIAIETVGIDCGDVTPKAIGDLLVLDVAQTCPGGPNRESCHRGNIEATTDDRIDLLEPPALTQHPSVLHRAEQRVVEAFNGIAAARRRGMHGVGEYAEAEPRGESCGFEQ